MDAIDVRDALLQLSLRFISKILSLRSAQVLNGDLKGQEDLIKSNKD